MIDLNDDTRRRFWSKVDMSGDCWEWMSTLQTYGYGLFYVDRNRHSVRAHRLSYEMSYGPIPDGLVVCHTCDNPKCVRPDHLFVGTNKDNTWDAIRKGRMPSVEFNNPGFLRDISEKYRAGSSLRDISEKYGVSPWPIRYHLMRSGVQMRPKSSARNVGPRVVKLSIEDRHLIASLYQSGESVANLSRRFGVDRATIRYHLKQARVHRTSA